MRRILVLFVGAFLFSASVSLEAGESGPGFTFPLGVLACPASSPPEELQGTPFLPPLMFESPDLIEQLKRSHAVYPRENRVQEDLGGNEAMIPAYSLIQDFQGTSYTGWIPPDPVIAVGPDAIVVVVNSTWAAYTKTGILLWAQTLSDWFSIVTPPGAPFDPKVLYDHTRDKWVLLALAVNWATDSSSYLISASTTSSPSGSWWLYNLDATVDGSQPTNNWADFPGLGYDSLALYVTSNQYDFGGAGFQYAKLRVLHKDSLFIGAPAPWYDFWNYTNGDGSTVFTWKPAHSFGLAEYLLNTKSGGWDNVTLWSVVDPLAIPTLTREATLFVGNYTVPPNAPQMGDTARIHTFDCRTQDVVVRDSFLYTAFTEAEDWGSGSTEAAVRYLKVDVTSDTVLENITFGSDNYYYYYPNVYSDDRGNLAMVFSRSGYPEYAGVRFTAKDSLAGSWDPSQILRAGEGPYERRDGSDRNRWGDYSGAALDPSGTSPRHLWIYGEYAADGNVWGTWIGEISFLVGVEEKGEARSKKQEAGLLQCYPNPFGAGGTTISFNVKRSTLNVSLRVYDLSGRLIRTLLDGEPIANSEQPMAISWDGRDGSGRPVGSGVYFCKLTTAQLQSTAKMTLLK